MLSEKSLMMLQKRLARAEREGNAFEMAKGYIILADQLLRAGNRRLGRIFVKRAGECLEDVRVVSLAR